MRGLPDYVLCVAWYATFMANTSNNEYRVFWTNHGYFSSDTFVTLADAVAYGKSKCFEFSVFDRDTMHVSWSPIGGLRTWTREGEVFYCRLYNIPVPAPMAQYRKGVN
jgi:hypothetical protein